MFVTKRCDVTILRFRNSGIGRKKKRVTKNCCLPLGVSRLAEPSVLMRGSSLAAHGKSAFFSRSNRTRSLECRARANTCNAPAPLYLCLISSIRKAFACLKLVCQLNSQAYCSENRKKTLTIFEVTIFHTIRFLRHVKFYKILHSIRKIDLRCLPMTCTRATL